MEDKHVEVKSDIAFGRLALVIWSFLLTIPLWSWLPILEGKLLPVTSTLELVQVERQKDTSVIYVRFSKKRPCVFKSISWYQDGRKLYLEFGDDKGESDPSRPTGLNIAGPWLVGSGNLDGSVAKVRHSCHPFWDTITHLYP